MTIRDTRDGRRNEAVLDLFDDSNEFEMVRSVRLRVNGRESSWSANGARRLGEALLQLAAEAKRRMKP